MPETEDVIELNEKRLRELLRDLENMNGSDPNYKKIAENIEILTRSLESQRQTELKRLDNNARIDIEEQKVVIELEKCKNEKARIRGEWWNRVGYGALVTLSAIFSYNMDKLKIPSKPIVWARENFLKKFMR